MCFWVRKCQVGSGCIAETEGSLVKWIWEDWGRSAMESVGCVYWFAFGLPVVND